MESIKGKYELTREVCSEISSAIMDFCTKIRVERKEAFKVCLCAEDCLEYWVNNGLEGNRVTLRVGLKLTTPVVSLEIEGDACNPFETEKEEIGTFVLSIQVGLNMKPAYSYSGRKNRVQFRLKKQKMNPLVQLGLILAVAVAVGLLGMLLPAETRQAILDALILPVYNAFFRLLGIVAGPMVFLSVVWGIYGIGDVETLGRVGKKLIIRFLLIVLTASCFAAVTFPILGPGFSGLSDAGGELSDISELILDVIPPNLVAPFSSGNTLQIIFLALIIGIGLLYLGKRTEGIVRGVEQINSLIRFLMEIVGKLLPFAIFLVVVNMIWSGALQSMGAVWKLFAVYAGMMLAAGAFYVLYTARKQKVRVGVLIKKSMPAFSLAFSTASSAASLGVNAETCRERFGIDASLVDFGLPLGTVLHRPILAISNAVVLFFYAGVYNISCSPIWLITAVVISAAMAIAAPPIPGGGAIVYTLMFSQMGIPAEAVAGALTINVIVDFFNTALGVATTALALVNAASDLEMIDLEILRSTRSAG